MSNYEYSIVVSKLRPEDGTGYVAFVPDLQGCMSDGETPEEALVNAQQAISEWIETAQELGRPIPLPGSATKTQAEKRSRLVKQITDQKAAFEALDHEIQALRDKIESISERLLNEEAAWTPDVALLSARNKLLEDNFH